MTISLPRASAVAASSERGRVVVDHVHGLRLGDRLRERGESRTAARGALSAGEVEFDVGVAGGRGDRRDGGGESGARPRLVCTSTPVALITLFRPPAVAGKSASATSAAPSGSAKPSRTCCWALDHRCLDEVTAERLLRGGQPGVVRA